MYNLASGVKKTDVISLLDEGGRWTLDALSECHQGIVIAAVRSVKRNCTRLLCLGWSPVPFLIATVSLPQAQVERVAWNGGHFVALVMIHRKRQASSSNSFCSRVAEVYSEGGSARLLRTHWHDLCCAQFIVWDCTSLHARTAGTSAIARIYSNQSAHIDSMCSKLGPDMAHKVICTARIVRVLVE